MSLELYIFLNDLSLHGQFSSPSEFRSAFGRMMRMREIAKHYGYEIYCNRQFYLRDVLPGQPISKALSNFPPDKRRMAMSWMAHSGPYWDELRQIQDNGQLKCRGKIVANHAIREAAIRCIRGIAICDLVSFSPSDWMFSPIECILVSDDSMVNDICVSLHNWHNSDDLRSRLRATSYSVRSWDDLRAFAQEEFQNVIFTSDCFRPLEGLPFVKSVADGTVRRLEVLNRIAIEFDSDGKRTSKWHRMWKDYFAEGNAWFSDSSEREKQRYKSKLSFRHPEDPQKRRIFCPLHAKVGGDRTMALRIHFSAIRSNDPVYIVYIGPKITRG